MTNDEVKASYGTDIEQLDRKAAANRASASVTRMSLLGSGAALLIAFYAGLWLIVLAAAGLVFSVPRWAAQRRVALDLARRRAFAEACVLRVAGEWSSPHTGLQYTPSNHPFAGDLNITGENSLFSTMCTARTELGRRRLAEFLLDTPSFTEATARQRAVHELRSACGLREDVAVLGDYDFQESRWDTFQSWLGTPPIFVKPVLIWLARLGTLLMAASSLVAIFQALPWNRLLVAWQQLIPAAAIVAAFQIAMRFALRKHLDPIIENSRHISSDLNVCHKGLLLLAAHNFKDVPVPDPAALPAIAKLNKLAGSLSASTQGLFDWPAWLLLADIHIAILIANWRARNGDILRNALHAWAEFEALNAIAGYAWEHPEDAIPKLLPLPGILHATALAHPLIPAAAAVANDISLDSTTKFFIISGSNMSGKSTLMRAIGANVVLAGIGAPVRAKTASLSLSHLHASIQTSDSLADGKSRFLAETESIRDALQDAHSGGGVLFLVDELFGGTNSHDRRIAAERIVRALLDASAIGVISTHDLALTEIAEAPGLYGSNVHMSCIDEDHPLDFDYKLNAGIYRGSNALAIVRLVLGAGSAD